MKKFLLVKKIIGSVWIGGTIACGYFLDIGVVALASLLIGFFIMVITDEVAYYKYDMYWPEMKQRIKEEETPKIILPTTRLVREE